MNDNSIDRPIKRGAWFYLSTWFGCGLSPLVSGTVGSLGALPFAYVIQHCCGNVALFIASILIFIVGVWSSNKYLFHTGRNDDPSEIVIDEVAGQWMLLSFLPLSLHAYILGFVLFRTFDIIKPWPICVADEKIKGGFGVMFDDILAAIYPPVLFFIAVAVASALGKQQTIYDWLALLT